MSVPLLFVSGEYPPDVGGVGEYTARLRIALSAEGWLSTVLTRRRARRWDARSVRWLLRAAPRRGLVHIQYQAAAYDLLGDVCLFPQILRLIRPRVRVVTTLHDAREPYLFPRAGSLRSAALRLLARSSHAVIAADIRDLAAVGGPSARHHHVPIGSNISCLPLPEYDRGEFRRQLGLEPDTLAVAYFGLLNASKGLDLLLDTFELVRRTREQSAGPKGARLLLLGGAAGASDPTDQVTAARVQSRLDRLGDDLIRTGWLAPPALSAHLLAADVALLPYVDGASARRGSLLACAEHGLPIVSTAPAAPEVSDTVQAVMPDPRALADAVLAIADDPARRGLLRAASHALAQRTAWPRIAAAHVKIYESQVSSETYTPRP